MPFKSRFEVSLRWKVIGLITISVLVVLSVSTAIGYARQRQRSLENMTLLASQTGQIIEHALERDMLVSDFASIQATFDSIANDDRVKTLKLLDTGGNVIFSPHQEGTGQQLSNQHETCQPCHRYSASERPSGVIVKLESGHSVFRSMQPIENRSPCTRCHDPDQALVGLLLTDLSIEPVEAAIALDLRENLFWLAGTVVTTTVLASFAVNRWVLDRLRSLAGAMEAIGLHGLSERLPEEPSDEIGRLSAAFNDMAERVARRNSQNMQLSQALERRANERGMLLQRLITAQEEERIRVARELHDELGQTLSSTALTIELSQRALDQQASAHEVSEHLRHAHDQIAAATDHMYDLILGLRPSVLDDLGLAAALRTLAQRILEPAGLTYEIDTQDLHGRLAPITETSLFRIIQEAMTNIHKHAEASHVDISLKATHDEVIATIADDGRGFSTSQVEHHSGRGHLGLLGIRERAVQMGGTLTIDSHPGSGTTLTVQLLLEDNADE